MLNSFRSKLGQNTAEYLIMLVLVAVGSIGMFSVFGDTLKKQVRNVIAAMGGESTFADTANSATADGIINQGTTMNVTTDNVIAVPGSGGGAGSGGGDN